MSYISIDIKDACNCIYTVLAAQWLICQGEHAMIDWQWYITPENTTYSEMSSYSIQCEVLRNYHLTMNKHYPILKNTKF